MQMLLTTLGFVGITGFLMAFHLRRDGGWRASKAAAPADPLCPRCEEPVRHGAASCPSCGVPRQAYEVVSARAVEGEAVAPDGPLHAVVRGDMCVGCGTCVAACPVPGAIRLAHKLAVVDLELCQGHAACVAACPMGAILVTAGEAVQRVEVPEVNAHFESNLAGLYVVGELGGRGLIKNAINEGKIAVEHVARVLQRGAPPADFLAYDVLIVGSGPAGLSAGLEALRAGLRYVVLEQGTLADSIRKYPRQKLLLAEPVRVPLYGDLWVADASKEALLQVWENVIAATGLEVRTGQRVDKVFQEGGVFRVATGDREYRARTVVLALGRRGTPRRLGVPGEEAEKVLYDIVEMEAFAGARVLVVGGGDSAIESALGLSNQAETAVTLSYRGTEFSRLKDRNRTKLEAAVAGGKVALLLESQVREIEREAVTIEQGGHQRVLPNDFVIVRIGGEPPYPFLQRIGVRIVQKEIAVPEAQAAAAG